MNGTKSAFEDDDFEDVVCPIFLVTTPIWNFGNAICL
jgi:hypothetical protein